MPVAEFQRIAETDAPQPGSMLTLEDRVAEGWIDYNGHMTEWQYYRLLCDGGENFLQSFGFDEAYRNLGYSYFSVEGHMRNLHECRAATSLQVHTDLIGYDSLRLHIYQYVVDTEREVTLATGEHVMLHVDTSTRRAAPAPDLLLASLAECFQRHAPVVRPRGLGGCTSRIRA